MNTSFAGGTDPTPYIAAAYLIGAALLLGYYAWTVVERRKLRRLLAAVHRKS